MAYSRQFIKKTIIWHQIWHFGWAKYKVKTQRSSYLCGYKWDFSCYKWTHYIWYGCLLCHDSWIYTWCCDNTIQIRCVTVTWLFPVMLEMRGSPPCCSSALFIEPCISSWSQRHNKVLQSGSEGPMSMNYQAFLIHVTVLGTENMSSSMALSK